MFRPVAALSPPPRDCSHILSRLLAPLTLWICVSVSLRYGYYGDSRMVLGPSSSRLIGASSLFVDQVRVRDEENKGAVLYGFSHMPELSRETNWSASIFFIVTSHSREGFHLWLNKGSRVRMGWEAQATSLTQLQMVIIKGERKNETVMPKSASTDGAVQHNEQINGKEAEFTAKDDDTYYIGMINTNSQSVIITMNVNVTSKTYDLTKASHVCSTSNGSCQMKLLFPETRYLVLTTPNNGKLGGWYVELSFMARVITYVAILGFVMVAIFMVLKYLGACDGESTISMVDTPVRAISTETDPIMPPEKPIPFTYGTNEEDEESGASSSSSEDLYDAKLCAICYDEQRNCFFVPCGHCATCYDCAQRIMEEENKMCPICRRPIHKVRRLFSP